MGNVKSEVVIENENLFRALVFGPVAILLVLFGSSFLMSPGVVLFKVIYVLMASYFSISALAHAAFYTDELYAGEVESFIKNDNLFKAIVYSPLAILFWTFAVNSIMSSGHIVFNVIYILIAFYLSLSALAYAAFYTNECYAETPHGA
jgi:uncharacterized membrane protein YqjE